MEGHPWAEMGKSRKPITLNKLARMLKPLGVGPVPVGRGKTGCAAIGAASSRKRSIAICQALAALKPHTRPATNKNNGLRRVLNCTPMTLCAVRKRPQVLVILRVWTGVRLKTAKTAKKRMCAPNAASRPTAERSSAPSATTPSGSPGMPARLRQWRAAAMTDDRAQDEADATGLEQAKNPARGPQFLQIVAKPERAAARDKPRRSPSPSSPASPSGSRG